jgi:hypothetical protein
MNTKMIHHWKKQMFGMQPSNVSGICLGLLMKLDFKSWKIGLVFGTSMLNNGEDL